MGYSIAVPVRSEKLRQKMQAFMDANYRDVSQLLEKWKHSFASEPTGDLAYDDGKCRIGFNFNASGPERQYIFAAARWMAIQVGRKRTLELFYGTGVRASVPYYVYDGHDACPIVFLDEWKDKAPPRDGDYPTGGWEMHDKYGWLVSGNYEVRIIKSSGIYPKEHQKVLLSELDALYDEIKRLDQLWKEA